MREPNFRKITYTEANRLFQRGRKVTFKTPESAFGLTLEKTRHPVNTVGELMLAGKQLWEYPEGMWFAEQSESGIPAVPAKRASI